MLSLSLPTKHQVQEGREDFSASLQIDKDATEAIDILHHHILILMIYLPIDSYMILCIYNYVWAPTVGDISVWVL